MKRLKKTAEQCDDLIKKFAAEAEDEVLTVFSGLDEEFIESVLNEVASDIDEETKNTIFNNVLADPENKLTIDFVAEYKRLFEIIKKHIESNK